MELQNQRAAPSSLEILPCTVRVTYFPPFTISATLTILAAMWGSKERRWEHSLLQMYFKVNEKSASPFAPSASCSHPQTSADLQQQPEFSNPQLLGCGGSQPIHQQPKTGQDSPLGHLEPLSTQTGLKPVIRRVRSSISYYQLSKLLALFPTTPSPLHTVLFGNFANKPQWSLCPA